MKNILLILMTSLIPSKAVSDCIDPFYTEISVLNHISTVNKDSILLEIHQTSLTEPQVYKNHIDIPDSYLEFTQEMMTIEDIIRFTHIDDYVRITWVEGYTLTWIKNQKFKLALHFKRLKR